MRNKMVSFFMCGLITLLTVCEVVTPVKAVTDTNKATESEDTDLEENDEASDENDSIETIINQEEEAEKTLEQTAIEYETINIDSASDFAMFAKHCRLDTWSANKRVVLNKDILLTGVDFVTVPYFAGIFEGQGHTISGYVVNDEQSNIALFAYTAAGSVISELNVVADIYPEGHSNIIGGISSHNSGVIKNCSFNGIVSGRDYVGGIVGINELKGVVADCVMTGFVSGEHFVGGIAGENMGNILRCTNNSSVNTHEKNVTKSIEDINFDHYISLFSINNNEPDSEKESMINGIVDTGGIAGVSVGIIKQCRNNGEIGYEKLGYNVGGIAGRQSGYITECTNTGKVLGRKDVGGIAGQAEPYVTIDFSQDIVRQLSDNISKLHDIIAVTLEDADGQSDVVSNRLSIIQSFTNNALDDTGYLADNTVTFVDSVMGEANKAASRAEFLVDEMAKNGGVLDQMSAAADNAAKTGEELINTIEDFEITQYLTPEEQARLDADMATSKSAIKTYSDYVNTASNAFKQYYRDKLRANAKYWTVGYVDEASGFKFTEQNMFPTIKGVLNKGWPKYDLEKDSWSDEKIYAEYKDIDGWVHIDSMGNVVYEYPAPTGTGQDVLDAQLEDELNKVYGTIISTKAAALANEMFSDEFGTSPQDYFSLTLSDAVELIYEGTKGMKDKVPDDAEKTLEYMRRLSANLKSAFGQTKQTFGEISAMDDIELPKLGEEYRAHCASLNNSLQGMSDNFGYLNSEMNNASHEMIGDLSAVNDQFNVIMELYTDAIDGVLEKDYSTVIQDDSDSVAEECIDATIADCINYGDIKASIDTAGIVGTMAIEYDYDLESDVTGIKDSNLNTTYLTKCILRQNTNRGLITGQKDYVGGVCGLQEMGIILRCGNYSKTVSSSGDYVGGVAGSSMSKIMNSYEKSLVKGGQYVGGIAGKGADILSCAAVVNIVEPAGFSGAIAGYVSDGGTIRENYFVSDELAGIDRVSYSGKAEPVEYSELLGLEGIPSDFKSMKIKFFINDTDENGEEIERTLSAVEYKYGSKVTEDMFPTIPYKDGFYSKWETECIDEIVSDMEIAADYLRIISTLDTDTLMQNKQSQILVDGYFTEGDAVEAKRNVNSANTQENSIECWQLTIPDDGRKSHIIRYHLPDGMEDIGDDFGIYACDNGKWNKVTTSKMGAYTIFELNGNDTMFEVVNEHKSIPTKWIIIGSSCAGVAVVIIIVVICASKKSKKKRLSNNI